MLSFQQNNPSIANVSNQMQAQNQSQQQNNQPDTLQQLQQQQPPTMQTMRLRDDPPTIVPAPRASRKRKSPPSNNPESSQNPQQPPLPPPPSVQHILAPGHNLIHPPPHMQGPPPPLPPGYVYATADYTPGGMPPPHPNQQPPGMPQDHSESPPPGSAGGRALSSSKRAEQNRKAQRAFRERRDQHVKALESRSQLLDAALASADEANRRWEECRALVDQLRVENTALRAHLNQAQMLPLGAGVSLAQNNGAQQEETKRPEESNQLKNDSAEPKLDNQEAPSS